MIFVASSQTKLISSHIIAYAAQFLKLWIRLLKQSNPNTPTNLEYVGKIPLSKLSWKSTFSSFYQWETWTLYSWEKNAASEPRRASNQHKWLKPTTRSRPLLNPIQPPSGKIVITPSPKELWCSNFLTFPKIYLGTFWYYYHVHVIYHVAMATSFSHISFGKFKKMVNFLF